MQRKQQVGECWVYVIFFACVCVGASNSTIASDNPSSSGLCVVCVGRFPRGVPGGVGMPPPGYAQYSASGVIPDQRLDICFWAVFAIFSGFCYF
jgi:hypothetical protein